MTLTKQKNYEMVLPNNYVDVDQEEKIYTEGGGRVGFTVYLSPHVINAGSIVGGSIVTGAVATATAPWSALGPWGIGAAVAVSGISGGLAGMAISQNWKQVDITVDVPFVSDFVQSLYV